MVKSRNRIFYMYFDINNGMIYEIIQNNLRDLEAFIKTIVKNISL